MNYWQQLPQLFRQHWKKLVIITVVLAAVLCILLVQLGSLTNGISDGELKQRLFSGDWHNIVRDPLYAPLTLLQWLGLAIAPQSQALFRLPSVLFGLLSLGSLGYILRRWYGVRTTVFSIMLIATSAWFLHVSRYAGTEVLYFWAVPTLLAAQIWWERTKYSTISTILLLLLLAVLLYIPGMFWLMVISFGLQAHQVTAAWQRLQKWPLRLGIIAGGLALIVPLILAIVRDTSLWLNWLGFPSDISPTNIPRNLLHSISFFVWRGPAQPELWLDRLPVLDFFSLIMLILGGLFYARHVAAPRSRMLIGAFVVGAVFFAIQGPVGFSVLVPLVYIVIASGIGYLLREWLKVFPRNPLARSMGYGLIGIMISLAGLYGLRSYFVAWPHAPVTKTVFHNRL